MKQILQKRRLTTNSHDPRYLFSLLILTIILFGSTLPVLGLTAEDQAEIRDLVNRGNGLMNAGRYKEALDEYEAVLRIDPENYYGKANRVLTHNKWALSLFRQNKYKEARQHWDIAHKLNPNDATVNQNLKVLEFRLQKLGITEEAEEKPDESKGAQAGAPPVFDPLRESSSDWSPFGRKAPPQANSAQTQQRPAGGAFNVGGGIPPSQAAQGAPRQQAAPPPQVTQSGPQLIGGVSGSPSVAPSGPMVISGGTTSGESSSGPVMLNGSASGGPAAVSDPFSSPDPGAVSNQGTVSNGGTFTLSAGTSNSESPEDDFSAVKIVGGGGGGAAASAQGANEAHEGLPFTDSSSPVPGGNTSSTPNVPASGYAANAGPSYEAASHTAQGQALASNQAASAGNPAGATSSPPASANPPSRGYITGQQAYGGAPVSNGANSPPTSSYPANSYQQNNYQPNSYQSNSAPPVNTAPSFQPAGNVNMSFGTTGNVVIPPPAHRHGTGTAYKFPTNIVPPRAAPGFLGEAPPSAQVSTPSSSYPAGSGGSNSQAQESTESYADEPSNTPRPAASETSSDNSAATVNKILTEIEKKVYGKTSENLPILKRLERIEIDTLGKKVTGSINDRLNKLKETYGL